MRSRYLLIGLSLVASAAAFAGPPKSSPPAQFPKTVFLEGPADLEHLRLTNPRHYLRVERILASADQLCKAGEPKLLALQLGAPDATCMRSFIFTSYPPQRRLTFRLDDTRYIAMVVLEGAEGRFTPVAHPSPKR